MSTNTLEVRFQLKYDTFSHWMASDTILMPGEIAIATFPNISTISTSDSVPQNTPPAVGIKVGDGLNYFSELPWLQGVAGDVYEWAKSSTKPSYEATEIAGLAEYIAAHTSGGGGGGGGVSGAYRILYDSSNSRYILQQYDDSTSSWQATVGDTIDLASILNRINTIERWANGEKRQLGNIELPLTSYIYDEVITYLNRLDVNDMAETHQFVTQVEQIDGKIRVTRSIISASDITSGVLTTAQGGTGLTSVEDDELLIGSSNGTITKRQFVTEIDTSNRSNFATVGAIIDYVTEKTAGLTGAMHFIGESSVIIDGGANSRVDPQIIGYNFRYAKAGDVILANNAQEYVWTGENWRLLGDEGSYAVKGSIVNADIAEEANIAQSKIDGLGEALNNKVDKVEGKGLSSNDYTTEDKEKLRDIESGAQVNIIEHVFLNDEEIAPSTVSGQPKSIDLHFNGMTPEQGEKLEGIEAHAEVNVIEHIQLNGNEITPNNQKTVNIEINEFTTEEKEKLQGIEAEAQVNKVETLTINGTEYTPDNNKNIEVTIDQAALDLDVLVGARVPSRTSGQYEEVDVVKVNGEKKLELARIAKTGILSDTAANWTAHPIVPSAGELIVYSPDTTHSYSRLKIGDGSTSVTALPFIDAGTIDGNGLPEGAVFNYPSRSAFPATGVQNALYVDLAKNIIYCYTPANGYSQLSNFKYTITKQSTANITSWLPGVLPTFVVEGGRLTITTGNLPSLTYETYLMVREVTKEAEVE